MFYDSVMQENTLSYAYHRCNEAERKLYAIESWIQMININNKARIRDSLIQELERLFTALSAMIQRMKQRKMFSKQVLAEMQLYVNYINRFKKDIEEMLTRRLPAEKETAVLELDKKALLQRVKYVQSGLDSLRRIIAEGH